MIECYTDKQKYYVSVFVFRVEVDVTKSSVCMDTATFLMLPCFKRILLMFVFETRLSYKTVC